MSQLNLGTASLTPVTPVIAGSHSTWTITYTVGPLGIDCFRFRTADGAMATRLCNDINGRFTMGRLALQLRPRLREKPVALWCQVATSRFPEFPDSLPETLHQWGFGNVEAEVTSPQVIGNAAVANSTVLFAGSSRAELLKLAETLQARPKPE